ncbi:MAG: hypothetical protein RTV41_15150 [Candidatus Thorarchaeota archaeon]
MSFTELDQHPSGRPGRTETFGLLHIREMSYARPLAHYFQNKKPYSDSHQCYALDMILK